LAFVANLFNTIPGLEPLTEAEKAKLDEALFASEGSREARAFALWVCCELALTPPPLFPNSILN
jgi:plastin-1